MTKEKTRGSGKFTEAQFTSFVKSQLRGASWKWPCTSIVYKKARTRKGFYMCAGCNQEVTASVVIEGKRRKNVYVDHDPPVIDPSKGFTSWDSFINNLYCEEDKLRILCLECHSRVTADERLTAKLAKKELNDQI